MFHKFNPPRIFQKKFCSSLQEICIWPDYHCHYHCHRYRHHADHRHHHCHPFSSHPSIQDFPLSHGDDSRQTTATTTTMMSMATMVVATMAMATMMMVTITWSTEAFARSALASFFDPSSRLSSGQEPWWWLWKSPSSWSSPWSSSSW